MARKEGKCYKNVSSIVLCIYLINIVISISFNSGCSLVNVGGHLCREVQSSLMLGIELHLVSEKIHIFNPLFRPSHQKKKQKNKNKTKQNKKKQQQKEKNSPMNRLHYLESCGRQLKRNNDSKWTKVLKNDWYLFDKGRQWIHCNVFSTRISVLIWLLFILTSQNVIQRRLKIKNKLFCAENI